MVEFIKGKWYKGQSNDYYIKFSHLENYASGYNYICYTERCYQKRYKKEEGSWANTEFEIYALNNPVTLEELQKFLPKGHPDLQLNNVIELW
jgi:hypothetical protein